MVREAYGFVFTELELTGMKKQRALAGLFNYACMLHQCFVCGIFVFVFSSTAIYPPIARKRSKHYKELP